MEIHLYILSLFHIAYLKHGFPFEVEHPGKNAARKHLAAVVIVLYHCIIIFPRVCDIILQRLQLLLKIQEILIRLQLRIPFRYSKQGAERAGELILTFQFLTRVACALDHGPGSGDAVKGL